MLLKHQPHNDGAGTAFQNWRRALAPSRQAQNSQEHSGATRVSTSPGFYGDVLTLPSVATLPISAQKPIAVAGAPAQHCRYRSAIQGEVLEPPVTVGHEVIRLAVVDGESSDDERSTEYMRQAGCFLCQSLDSLTKLQGKSNLHGGFDMSAHYIFGAEAPSDGVINPPIT